jgi:predicted secreted hydrolase
MKISRRALCAATLAFASGARADGFAGLGDAATGYAAVTPGQPLVFPQDFGAHESYRTEWWYLTANLTDESGAAYGVQWTLFRQALAPQSAGAGWATPQLWMAHAAATSASEHIVAEKFARGGVGQAEVAASPFCARIDDWRFEAEDEKLTRAFVRANGASFSYELELAAQGPLVLQGEAGYSRKSDGPQASYYFSQPFFLAEGELRIGARAVRVSGKAWMDREWSSQPLSPKQSGWDWFSLHLDGGEKLMLFRMRDDTRDGFRSGAWIDAKGAAQILAAEDILLTPLSQTSIDGRMPTTHWRVQIPSKGFDVEAKAVNARSWMKTSFAYWEGPIVVTGAQHGVGYLEMTGVGAR